MLNDCHLCLVIAIIDHSQVSLWPDAKGRSCDWRLSWGNNVVCVLTAPLLSGYVDLVVYQEMQPITAHARDELDLRPLPILKKC